MISTTNMANDYVGLSTDTKPTVGIGNGSKFTEMDTASEYIFDEQNAQWLLLGQGQGGGSGMFVLNLTWSDDDGLIWDKTEAEVEAVASTGAPIMIQDAFNDGYQLDADLFTTSYSYSADSGLNLKGSRIAYLQPGGATMVVNEIHIYLSDGKYETEFKQYEVTATSITQLS